MIQIATESKHRRPTWHTIVVQMAGPFAVHWPAIACTCCLGWPTQDNDITIHAGNCRAPICGHCKAEEDGDA